MVIADTGLRHPGCVQICDAAAGFSDMNFTIGKKVSGLGWRFYHRVKQLEKHVEFQKKCNGFIETI